MLDSRPGEIFARQRYRDRIDRASAVARGDHFDERQYRVGHQTQRVGAGAAVRLAVAGQVERVDRSLVAIVVVQWLDLVRGGGSVDAVDQEQRNADGRWLERAGMIESDSTTVHVDRVFVAAERRWQGGRGREARHGRDGARSVTLPQSALRRPGRHEAQDRLARSSRCRAKKRSISCVASTPRGSVYVPAASPPAHAWPAASSFQCSTRVMPSSSWKRSLT